MKYTEAFAELQRLVREMESGQIEVDQLGAQVKRATELVAACRAVLTETEADVQKILDDLQKGSKNIAEEN
ncbi:MAG: exodeoxyribonuclease small subunit [Bacteroidota bacterium]|jgi:exodeoxyribonuclease VII small subunit